MLTKIFNTLRVLQNGPDQPEDVELIPSTLFNGRENFNDAVIELLNKADVENIFDFLKYTICIDTSIRHRLNEHSGGLIDGALIQPEDYLTLLNTIDATFGVNEDTFGVNVISSAQHPNPVFSGLSGAFLQLILEVLGLDQFEVFKGLVEFNLAACASNPSTTNVWWMDALEEIYSYEMGAEEEEWFNLNGSEDQREAIQIWFLKITNVIGKQYAAFEHALQTLREPAIANKVMELQLDLQVDFVNTHEEKIDRGHVCEPIPTLCENGNPYNIEQCLAVVMLYGN